MRLRATIGALALAALSVASFVTFERVRGSRVPCPVAGGGCEAVARSSYSQLAGVPVSVLGIAGALALLAALWLPEPQGASIRLSLAVVGAAFSGYLIWLEAARIHAYCAWCLVSAALWASFSALALADARRATADAPRAFPHLIRDE